MLFVALLGGSQRLERHDDDDDDDDDDKEGQISAVWLIISCVLRPRHSLVILGCDYSDSRKERQISAVWLVLGCVCWRNRGILFCFLRPLLSYFAVSCDVDVQDSSLRVLFIENTLSSMNIIAHAICRSHCVWLPCLKCIVRWHCSTRSSSIVVLLVHLSVGNDRVFWKTGWLDRDAFRGYWVWLVPGT